MGSPVRRSGPAPRGSETVAGDGGPIFEPKVEQVPDDKERGRPFPAAIRGEGMEVRGTCAAFVPWTWQSEMGVGQEDDRTIRHGWQSLRRAAEHAATRTRPPIVKASRSRVVDATITGTRASDASHAPPGAPVFHPPARRSGFRTPRNDGPTCWPWTQNTKGRTPRAPARAGAARTHPWEEHDGRKPVVRPRSYFIGAAAPIMAGHRWPRPERRPNPRNSRTPRALKLPYITNSP